MLHARPTAAIFMLSAAATTLHADVLVLRNGDRVEGELVSVSGSRIEFEDAAGDVKRFSRGDVQRIELDRYGRGESNDDFRPPRGAREREVNVPAADAWTDTGIDVRWNQQVYFFASGEVRWGPRRSDGPGGESGSPRNANRPIPDRPAAALIGRIGASGDPFFIGGDRSPIRVRGGGRLFLGVNDDYRQDNSGAFRVTVYY
jgi:hypothetical protein